MSSKRLAELLECTSSQSDSQYMLFLKGGRKAGGCVYWCTERSYTYVSMAIQWPNESPIRSHEKATEQCLNSKYASN